MELCGYCGGSGKVDNPTHDKYGYEWDGEPQRPCDYCGGAGECEEGEKLLPAKNWREKG